MEHANVLDLIKECLTDYASPIFISGTIDINDDENITKISATTPKSNLIINGNNYPLWYLKVLKNSYEKTNILCISDFDKISTEEQKLFMDIICRQYFSSEQLPSNLKIIITAEEECPIIPEIREVIQYIRVQG